MHNVDYLIIMTDKLTNSLTYKTIKQVFTRLHADLVQSIDETDVRQSIDEVVKNFNFVKCS